MLPHARSLTKFVRHNKKLQNIKYNFTTRQTNFFIKNLIKNLSAFGMSKFPYQNAKHSLVKQTQNKLSEIISFVKNTTN